MRLLEHIGGRLGILQIAIVVVTKSVTGRDRDVLRQELVLAQQPSVLERLEVGEIAHVSSC